jgi:LuxR family maltose regulon positive regulatory protein
MARATTGVEGATLVARTDAAPMLPLLATKLYAPPTPAHLVARPALIARIQAGLRAKLVLIAAAAGCGKTTLLSAWRASPGGVGMPLAWVALDAADNDPPRFWRYVLTALDALQPGICAVGLALLDASEPPPIATLVTSLANDLRALPADVALVLDDYHLIEAASIHEGISLLVDHAPPQLHLIISTRADPPLPLSRLRAGRQLTELRAADLRFTPAETATFLTEMMGLALSADDVATLEARTEGWIAGLQLAALALRDRADRASFIAAFAGTTRFVVDYLASEVLDQLPDHLRAFVLQTSILDRMCGPLCDAILGLGAWDLGFVGDGQAPSPKPLDPSPSAYSQLILEQLERANLFLVPLDDQRRWYRYHHLFAQVARERLAGGVAAEFMAGLHRRAGAWFAQQGLAPEAIQHALAARDVDGAVLLIERAAPTVLASGEITTLRNWLEALPDERVWTRPRLGLAYCWTLAFMARFEDLEARLREVERVLEAPSDHSLGERQALLSEVAVLRTRVAFHHNQAPDLVELRHALAGAPADSLRLRSLILLALAHTERLHGHSAEAANAYIEASALARRAGDQFTAGSALVALAELHEVQGQLHQATDAHQQGLQLATTPDGRPLPLAGFFHVGLGKQLREWNDLDAAAQHLRQGITLGQQGGLEGIELDGAITLALVLQAQGDAAGADAMLERAVAIARAWGLPQIVLRVATFEARLALMRGLPYAVARWAQSNSLSVDDEISEWLEIEYCTLARWQIAERRADDALWLLSRLAAAAEIAGRIGRLIELLALQALALHTQGATAAALAALERALALAAPEGYVRVFVDEGAPMAALLRAVYTRRVMPDYIAKLLAAFPRPESSGLRTESQELDPSVLSPQPASLIEPLTAREREVLRLLVAGRSNREIAGELVVAVGTVKAHVNSIFGKLGVASRTQAIAKARDLHVI